MSGQPQFRTATFKPAIDKAIARDGAHVVLWGDAEEAVVLRHRDALWLITRHPAIGADAVGTPARVSWQGVSYAASGERVAEFTDAATVSEWRQKYDELFAAQQERVRHFLLNESGSGIA